MDAVSTGGKRHARFACVHVCFSLHGLVPACNLLQHLCGRCEFQQPLFSQSESQVSSSFLRQVTPPRSTNFVTFLDLPVYTKTKSAIKSRRPKINKKNCKITKLPCYIDFPLRVFVISIIIIHLVKINNKNNFVD